MLIDDTPRPQLEGKPFASVLDLTVLNGDLFAPVDLDNCSLSNRDLLDAFWSLVWYDDRESKARRRVNYAALDVEELGSVYESLIEFHPAIQNRGIGFHFTLLQGTERKSTGSYYTPPELVNELIQSALDPVMRDRLQADPKKKEKSILSIRVCDPACGSGHFLLAAARHLGKELARVRTDQDEPAPEDVRAAIRDVVSHCIYGVDKNPLAVDLCKVALWIESYTEDKPLTFLDHRIRCGDSLVGVFDLNSLKGGIPDKAFDPVSGDDREAARAAIRRNREDIRGQFEFRWEPEVAIQELTVHTREIDDIADDSPENIRRKKSLFQRSHLDDNWIREKHACDLWTAAFFQTLRAEKPSITSGAVTDVLTRRAIDGRILGKAQGISARLNFFHWPLEFPEVFESGGFDVVLGNPPWERIKLEEQEFFSTRNAEIATAPNKAARARLIKDLPTEKPELWRDYSAALHDAEALSKFLRRSNRFALTARGDINTYAIFAEQGRLMLNGFGRAGILLPTGIATDDTTKLFFSDLIEHENLYQITGFENESFIFPAVHHSFKFCAFTMTGREGRVDEADFAFLCREFKDAGQVERHFRLRHDDLSLINPNTRTCPIFRTRADAALTRKIYERVPVLVNEQTGENQWGVKFVTMFHMANDSGLFRTREQLIESGLAREYNQFVKPDDKREIWLPLYEAKMIWHFDHRYGTYEGATQAQLNVGSLPRPSADQKSDAEFVVQPRYWVEAREVYLRSATLPPALLQALRDGNAKVITLSLAHLLFGNWLLQKQHYGTSEIFHAWCSFIEEYPFARQLAPTQMGLCGNNPACFSPLDGSYFPAVAVDEIKQNAREATAWYEADPNTVAEFLMFACTFRITSLKGYQIYDAADAVRFAEQLLEQKTPKWFLGFRDITNATNERTAICSLLPRAAVGHTMPLMLFRHASPIPFIAAFIVNTTTLIFDHIVRQKVGGTHLTFNVLNQLPVLAPSTYTTADVDFILPRALELLYTGDDLKPFAEDCGYSGGPFRWDEERRAILRADLDAYYAKLYGLTRDELRYILDPKDVYGEDFPSETFRVLKEKEIRQFGEYRTRRLVLEAWDKLFAL
ncbi:MAG TPA: N-6 DNA methylase [Pyrinomonadaceae bacterium]|nr:N-6 DNA methylase [Pyrinomonadaceae bacterium]